MAIFAVEGVEPTNLASSIAEVLRRAGLDAKVWRFSANIAVTGVVVSTKPGEAANVSQAAETLALNLFANGVDSKVLPWPGEWKDFGVLNGPPFDVDIPIRVLVGSKPQ